MSCLECVWILHGLCCDIPFKRRNGVISSISFLAYLGAPAQLLKCTPLMFFLQRMEIKWLTNGLLCSPSHLAILVTWLWTGMLILSHILTSSHMFIVRSKFSEVFNFQGHLSLVLFCHSVHCPYRPLQYMRLQSEYLCSLLPFLL
jgi:hypothetical protein